MVEIKQVHRRRQYEPEQIVEILARKGIDASEGISKLPSYVVKGYARINKPISFELGYAVGLFLIYPYHASMRENQAFQSVFGQDVELAKIQSSLTLAALHNRALYYRKGSHEQLAGIVAAVMDYDIGNASHGFLTVGHRVADNCGMGGDNMKRFNDNLQTFHISSASAILAASSGLKVIKHGSHGPKSNTQRTGSSDFVEFIGIDTASGPEAAKLYLERSNFGYTESIDTSYKSVHLVTQTFSHLSSMNDIIGPMTNPINPAELTVKLVGTNQIVPPMVVARAYALLNKKEVTKVEKGLFVRGHVVKGNTHRTIDEISILNAGTEAVLLFGEEVSQFRITYDTFGFRAPAKFKDLIPEENNAVDKIDYTRKVLEGDAPEGE